MKQIFVKKYREIAFDRWGAVQMTQNLENLGFTVVPFGQGFKDIPPQTKELMKLTRNDTRQRKKRAVSMSAMGHIYLQHRINEKL